MNLPSAVPAGSLPGRIGAVCAPLSPWDRRAGTTYPVERPPGA